MVCGTAVRLTNNTSRSCGGVTVCKPAQENVLESAKDRINTRAFEEWFADSKIVNDDGKPLVVYHGTPAGGFTHFDRKGSIGIFFSADPEMASGYAVMDRNGDCAVYPVYLSI